MKLDISERDLLSRHAKSFFYLKDLKKASEVLHRFLHLETHQNKVKPILSLWAEIVIRFGFQSRKTAPASARSWGNYIPRDRLNGWLTYPNKEEATAKWPIITFIEQYAELIGHDPHAFEMFDNNMEHLNAQQLVRDALDHIEFLEGLGFEVVNPSFPVHDLTIQKVSVMENGEGGEDVYFVHMLPSHPDAKAVIRTLQRSEPALVVVSTHWGISEWRRKFCSNDEDLYRMIGKVAPDMNGFRTLQFV